jgi:MYXO-CTERM domain-containing protein
LNATNFDFSISVNSPFTVQHGTAVLQVRNGIITVSTGTGMFANLFPTVGSAGNFLIPFTTHFSLDYNLGNFNGDPLAVQFTLANSGSAMARIDSDPSTGPPTDPPNDPPPDPNSTDLPEPATWATGGLALLLAGLARRR